MCMYCSSNGCYSRQYYYYHHRDTLGERGWSNNYCMHTHTRYPDCRRTNRRTYTQQKPEHMYIHTYIRTYVVDLAHAYPAELICRAYMHACMHTHTAQFGDKMQVCDANSKQMALATFKTFRAETTATD